MSQMQRLAQTRLERTVYLGGNETMGGYGETSEHSSLICVFPLHFDFPGNVSRLPLVFQMISQDNVVVTQFLLSGEDIAYSFES